MFRRRAPLRGPGPWVTARLPPARQSFSSSRSQARSGVQASPALRDREKRSRSRCSPRLRCPSIQAAWRHGRFSGPAAASSLLSKLMASHFSRSCWPTTNGLATPGFPAAPHGVLAGIIHGVLLRRRVSALWRVNRRPPARRRVNYACTGERRLTSRSTNLHYSLCYAEFPLRTP